MNKVLAALTWAIILSIACVQGANSCQVTFPSSNEQCSIFSPKQEVDLGNVIAESELLQLRIVATNDRFCKG